jgi:cell fate regulator YaaT (PSP1 superfamily)
MSTQEYYPRKNSLLTDDLGSLSLYDMQGQQEVGFQNKQDNSLLPSNGSQNRLFVPPGLTKTPVEDSHPFGRRFSSPNHLFESVQKNTSSKQEQQWAPEDRGINQIWDERKRSPDAMLKVPSLLPKFLEDGLDSPPPKTTRSLSFSVGHSNLDLLQDSKKSESGLFPSSLGNEYARSKSVSYDLAQKEEKDIFEGFASMSLAQRASVSSMASSDIWNPAPTEPTRSNFSPLYHRRASTQPMLTVVDPVVNDGNIMMSPEQINRYREQRKFTHAPSLMTEYIQRFNMTRGPDDAPYGATGRRHSVSSPVDVRKMQHDDQTTIFTESAKHSIEEINDYFENTENRAKAWAQAGKNLQAATRASDRASTVVDKNNITCNWPIYVVEFKAGRTDFFYVTGGLQVKVGDLVIVEADRGKDLGKVVEDSIYSMEELIQFKQKIEAKMPELYNGKSSIVPKCMYRLAQPSETSLLLMKSEDERKAMAACKQMILDRNLPMEIVDTEYQW